MHKVIPALKPRSTLLVRKKSSLNYKVVFEREFPQKKKCGGMSFQTYSSRYFFVNWQNVYNFVCRLISSQNLYILPMVFQK